MDVLLAQGLELMLYGMGFVLFFLLLLVLSTALMSALTLRFFPGEPAESPSGVSPQPGGEPSQDDVSPQVLAVIRAAIEQHRARHQ